MCNSSAFKDALVSGHSLACPQPQHPVDQAHAAHGSGTELGAAAAPAAASSSSLTPPPLVAAVSSPLLQDKLNIPPITVVTKPVVNVVNSAKKKLKKIFG